MAGLQEKLLFVNGDIHTVDDTQPTAAAVGVIGGTIAAVGSKDACRAALGAGLETVDLDGAALLPGFIDTHLHPVPMIYYRMNLNLDGVASLAALQDAYRAAAADKKPGEWVVGLQFDENSLERPVLLTRHDMDAACPDRPVVAIKRDGHMLIANTAAIHAAKVTTDTPAPAGGAIDREPGGHAAGPFRELAAELITRAMPMPTLESLQAGAGAAVRELLANGIVSAGAVIQTGSEGPFGDKGAFDVPLLQMLLPQIPLALYGLVLARDVKKILDLRNTPLHSDVPGGHRIGALKVYADGTYGSSTAFMNEPFSDQPDASGFLTMDEDAMWNLMKAAHAAGLQIATHCIGDRANRVVVDLYERLLREHPRADHRHRIEHASSLDASLVADMARLGITTSVQPMFIHSEKDWLKKRLGARRTAWAYPFRTLAAAGVYVAGASDAPLESLNVLHAMQCCVTREGFHPEQGVTAEYAIRMFTMNAARAQFMERERGSITPGKRADLAVLDASPAAADPDAIAKIRVLRTFIGGRTVYEA